MKLTNLSAKMPLFQEMFEWVGCHCDGGCRHNDFEHEARANDGTYPSDRDIHLLPPVGRHTRLALERVLKLLDSGSALVTDRVQ
jgi:hypothetical protein